MLLDESGLKITAFDPILAEILGDARGEEGNNILTQARRYGHGQAQYRDWLYCLADAPGTHLRKRLIDMMGQQPVRFIESIERAMDRDDEKKGLPPASLTSRTVVPAVLEMLGRVESIASEYGKTRINDAMLTLALIERADESLTRMLHLWAKEERVQSFLKYLREQIGPRVDVEVFGPEGRLNKLAFTLSGRRFCQRMSEDAASLAAKKITTRHMLYSLLSKESGLLPMALAVRGVDVKRDLHALLARELTRPGMKRNEQLQLTQDNVFDTVELVLKHSLTVARARAATAASEADIGHAFVMKQGKELARLFPPDRPLDLASLRNYVEAADHSEDDEDQRSAQRFTIGEIQEHISKRILGQEAAVSRVLPWIKRLRFGLPRDGRPAGVFLFLGPTGTGKTQLAKELARYVFGDEDMMIFLEMGQFQTKESMNIFIGSPPGYIGYGEGKLTNGLRDKPECVVLFDEIEKADKQVFDTLLRFADEGVISDPAGPVRDGRKCIIVLTTNAGQQWLRSHLPANPDARDDPGELEGQLLEAAMDELKAKGFRPEFLGRVDERITFLPFTLDVCRKIIDGILEKEIRKFNDLKGVNIDVSQAARDLMACYAFERSLDEGARGAPRAVNQYIVTPAIDLLSETGFDAEMSGPIDLVAEVEGKTCIKLEVIS